MKVDFPREICLKILHDIDEKNGYSNIILDEYLEKNRQKLNIKDISFISEIVYGTVMWKLTIDYIIQKYSKIKIKKISLWILEILRLSIYQIVFLDKIPKQAAVNEAVNLSKKYGAKSAGFVNAILRKIDKIDYQEILKIKDNKERISIAYSMPSWIVDELIKDYGIEKAEEICKNSTLKPSIIVRINTLKTNKEQFIKKLKELSIEYEETEEENFLKLKLQNIKNLSIFKEGLFTIQDESAGKCAIILNPKQKEKVLDACAAPGGKTTHLAEIMKNDGEIIAWDIHNHRLKLIDENADRLGIKIIKTNKQDATIFNEKYFEQFDKILLDVPCMGIGVIKRKPDIKWQRKKEDIYEITKIQKQILEICSKYLKKGGEIVYSTCSILKEENEDVIKCFLNKNGNFEIKCQKNQKKEQYNILPNSNKDGFFICKLIKK